MKYYYLSIMSSCMVCAGYFPEIYSTIIGDINHPCKKYSWISWIIAGTFGIIYSSLNMEYYIMINYSTNLVLSLFVLLLKSYCCVKIPPKKAEIEYEI